MTMTAKDTRQKPAEPTEAPGGQNGFSLISSGKLIELYAAMVKSRMVAERAGLLKQKGVLAGDLDGKPGARSGRCRSGCRPVGGRYAQPFPMRSGFERDQGDGT